MPATKPQRVLLIGLDCATPRFLFDSPDFQLPHLRRLMREGCWGTLRSCDPPITVPAWSCMTSGMDPGQLGLYGFRNRPGRETFDHRVATSIDVHAKRLWNVLSDAGRHVVALGVPQTFPPERVNGCMVSGLLTPDQDADFTHPKALKEELLGVLGEVLFDVSDFRTDDKTALASRIHRLMNNRFDAARYLVKEKPWDFFMMVDMGVDRLHHGFWKFADVDHPQYIPGNAFEHVVREYYEALDRRIGELVELAGEDEDIVVIVASDHGAKALHGGVRINQWLIQEGHLRLVREPPAPAPLRREDIDWPNTRAWSTGGYYARIYLNVAGRDPSGVIAPGDYEKTRDALADSLQAMRGPDEKPLNNRVLKPEAIYETVNGVAPDLLVYLGDLHWRAIGTVGHEGHLADENDTGPDDANHAVEGVFVMHGRKGAPAGSVAGLGVLDVAPTVLGALGLNPAPRMRGKDVATMRA